MEKTPLRGRVAVPLPQAPLAETLHKTMTRNWNDLEGVSIGRHWLKVCLMSSADDAWYLIRYDTTRDAAIRVRDAAAPDAELQLDLWRRATAIEHPHIVRMLDAGRADAEGEPVIYCVCE